MNKDDSSEFLIVCLSKMRNDIQTFQRELHLDGGTNGADLEFRLERLVNAIDQVWYSAEIFHGDDGIQNKAVRI